VPWRHKETGISLSTTVRIYRAVWAEALRKLLENVGVPATTLMAEIESQEVKDRLRQNTERAVERGAFGAPTFFVGSEMFWAMIASASSRRHWASWCEPA
jgi:2-hydroxychromene-2-carboxylate isomerase